LPFYEGWIEELTALPRDPSWIWGCCFAAGRGMGGRAAKEKKGKVAFLPKFAAPLPIIVN